VTFVTPNVAPLPVPVVQVPVVQQPKVEEAWEPQSANDIWASLMVKGDTAGDSMFEGWF
jgi:hypothetical protein